VEDLPGGLHLPAGAIVQVALPPLNIRATSCREVLRSSISSPLSCEHPLGHAVVFSAVRVSVPDDGRRKLLKEQWSWL